MTEEIQDLIPDVESGEQKVITFRVKDDVHLRVSENARKDGMAPNTWCRNLVIKQSAQGITPTTVERLLIEELAVLRYLVSMLMKKQFTKEECEKIPIELNRIYPELGERLIQKRVEDRGNSYEGEIAESEE